MTRKQEQLVERIREELKVFMYNDDYEIKTFKVEEGEYFVSVCASVGLKGDEGTMASIYGRDSIQIFIGKKGGLTYPVNKKLKDGSFKFVVRELHLPFQSLRRVSYEQEYNK